MSICVATLCSPDCQILGDITSPVKQHYCDRHGYDFELRQDGFTHAIPELGYASLLFERWWFALEIMQKHELALICGADVLITNTSVDLDSIADLRKPFLIAQDAWGLNSDVLLVRQEPRCLELIAAVANAAEEFKGAQFMDQSALASLAPQFTDIVEVLPQRLLNSYEYATLCDSYHLSPNYALALDASGNDGQWRRGDFILHTPGLTLEAKAALLRRATSEIRS